MTATVTQIRSGLAARLNTISGVRASASWPDTLNLPAAIVKPTSGQYHQAMGSPGYSQITFEIVFLAASTQLGLKRGQEALDPYLDASGSQSLKAALEGDLTLGGFAQTLIVTGWSNYGSFAVGEIEYIGAQLTVEVWP